MLNKHTQTQEKAWLTKDPEKDVTMIKLRKIKNRR